MRVRSERLIVACLIASGQADLREDKSSEHPFAATSRAQAGRVCPTRNACRSRLRRLCALMSIAAELRDRGHGSAISYSRKVFIPLTKLCRDSCHYCTFAQPPRRGERCFMTPDEVLAIAQAGVDAGCREALFTLGDKPELAIAPHDMSSQSWGIKRRFPISLRWRRWCSNERRSCPISIPGSPARTKSRPCAAYRFLKGLMLETAAERLSEKGGPHFGSPDKLPQVRLAMIESAGELAVPFTSGILIGIGETRAERIAALLQLRDAHERHGHLQEVIVQNFRAKPGTRMADIPSRICKTILDDRDGPHHFRRQR